MIQTDCIWRDNYIKKERENCKAKQMEKEGWIEI